MHEKTKGAWLIHHMNKLRHVTSVGDFDNIHTAGKLGVLLSGLSATESSSLTNQQVSAVAKAANISSLELSSLVNTLSRQRSVLQLVEPQQLLNPFFVELNGVRLLGLLCRYPGNEALREIVERWSGGEPPAEYE